MGSEMCIRDRRENGMRVLRGHDLRDFESCNPNLSDGAPNRRALAVFPRRAILNVGQMLTESDVARQVRTHLLNVEASPSASDSAAMELALRVISLQDRVAALTASNGSLAARCEEVSVKAEAYDDLIAREGVFDLDAAAKILGPVTGNAGPERFVNMLRGMEVIYQRSKLPRQELITRGYFAVRTEAEDGKAHPVTVVTMKGLSWLQAEFREERPTLTRVVDHNVRQLPQQPRGELG